MRALNKRTGQLEKVYIKALDSLPVGVSVEYAGDTIPSEMEGTWMFERGQELNRTEYADLFSRIGTKYGAGNGTTTFNLPNRCGKVAVGLDSNDTDFDTLGETGGEKAHTHLLPLGADGNSIYANTTEQTTSLPVSAGKYTNWSGVTGTSIKAISSKEANSLQPYIVVNYIIKVAETTPRSSETVNTFSNSTKNSYSCDYINNQLDNKQNGVWTLLQDNVSATANVDLSNIDFNELYVVIRNTNDVALAITQNIVKSDLTDTIKWYRNGYYYNAQVNSAVAVRASLTQINFTDYYVNNATANAKMTVYYR